MPDPFHRRAKRQPMTTPQDDDENSHISWRNTLAFIAMLIGFVVAFLTMTR